MQTDFFQTTIGQIIIQAIGIAAMSLTILCYQLKKRNHILMMQYSGNALWCVHYFLLGTYTALALNFIAVFRGIVYSIDKKWARSNIWVVVFCSFTIAFGIITYENWYSLLPTLGTTIATVALRFKNENNIRKGYLAAQPPWLAYNILVGSIPGALTTSFTIVSVFVSLIRYKGFSRRPSTALSEEKESPANDTDIIPDSNDDTDGQAQSFSPDKAEKPQDRL